MHWEITKLKHPGSALGTGYITLDFATCFESDPFNEQATINIPGRVSWEAATNIMTVTGPIPAWYTPGNEDAIAQAILAYKATYYGPTLPTGEIYIDWEMISGHITRTISPPPYAYNLYCRCRSMIEHTSPGYGCSDYDGSGIPRDHFIPATDWILASGIPENTRTTLKVSNITGPWPDSGSYWFVIFIEWWQVFSTCKFKLHEIYHMKSGVKTSLWLAN
jgi:hypothetical protein